jgi:RNA polymerase sigma factor (sigma-70 family)
MLKRFEYRDEHSLEAWIKKIMINQCLMSLRRKKMVITMDYTDTELQISRTENTELSAEEIVGLIQTLPEGYRTIFNLYVVDGYSHKEIAESLGISESASRSQLTHARNRLQQLLRTHGWK